MSGKARLAVLVVAFVGCTRSEQPAPVDATGTAPAPPAAQAPAPVVVKTDTPPAPTRPVISVGQRFDEALATIAATGARDFSANVGFFRPVPFGAPPQEERWFMLRNETCVNVLGRAKEKSGPLFVVELTLGEEGKGFGPKEHWLQQKKRKVSRLELP